MNTFQLVQKWAKRGLFVEYAIDKDVQEIVYSVSVYKEKTEKEIFKASGFLFVEDALKAGLFFLEKQRIKSGS